MPWVLRVLHVGGVYLVLAPFSPAMCSIWYRVRASSKSVQLTYSWTMSSIGIPTFTRKLVRPKRSMWLALLPDRRPSRQYLMHGGNASFTTSSGRLLPPSLDLFSSKTFLMWSRCFWRGPGDRKSTRLNSSHGYISYAVFC